MDIQTLFKVEYNPGNTITDTNVTIELVDVYEDYEMLPTPLPLTGPEARNYVAYIPVPLNDDEESEEDDDTEYYYDEDEYYDEYEEEEEEEKPYKPKRKNRQQYKRPNRRKYEKESNERVPFLVPLMMVPENQVGVQKEFSFNQNRKNSIQDELSNNVVRNTNIGEDNYSIHKSVRNPISRRRQVLFPQGRPVHNVAGPPYRGPVPRNPNLPLDDTIIHASVQRPVYRRPNSKINFQNRFFNRRNIPFKRFPIQQQLFKTSTTTTTTTTTTATTTSLSPTTHRSPSIIVVQQPGLSSPYNYMNPYQQPYYNYQPPQYINYPTTSTTTATTTTTLTTTITTTTKKPKKKRRKKIKYVDPMLSEGSLTIKDNKLVPINSRENLMRRFGRPASGASGRRFNPLHQRDKFRNKRKYVNRNYGRPIQSNRRYDTDRSPGNRRLDLVMPNIYSQSPYDFGEKPIISRPPPQHPGVRLPGIKVPPNAGNIQDIISNTQGDNRRYTTNDGKYTIINDYRPPLGESGYSPSHENSYVPPSTHSNNNYHTPHSNDYGYGYDSGAERPLQYDASPPKFPGDINNPVSQQYQPESPPHQQSNHLYQPTRPTPSPYEHINNQPTAPPYIPTAAPYQPHAAPYQPPAGLYQPPAAPISLTASPYQPTAAPYQPTAAPYQPTAAPYKPTAAPYRPTSAPYRPTAAPYQPTKPSYQPTPSNYQPTPIQQTYRPTNQLYHPPQSYNPAPAFNPNNRPAHEHSTESSFFAGDRPTENVVPGAYNQDFYTPDPYQNFPGSDIYENTGVHGPSFSNSAVPLSNQNFGDKKDDYNYNYIDTPQTVKRPNGPDYTSSTVIHSPGQKDSRPFKVGLDLYPLSGHNPLGKDGLYNLNNENNKHEVLLHLNLFSKKPTSLGGGKNEVDLSSDIGPFSFGRYLISKDNLYNKMPILRYYLHNQRNSI